MNEMLQSALTDIATELFEGAQGPGTWVVDNAPDQGIFGTLRALSAEEASRKPGPGKQSIAGHTSHLRFGIALANAYCRGEQPSHDWESSWETQEVSEIEWKALQASLRREVDEYMGHLSKELPTDDQETYTGWIASVVHTAFHLGSIRQLRP
jgi:hypothetical protein